MQAKSLTIACAALVGILLITFQVISDARNSISSGFLWITVIAAFISFVAPRAGASIMIWLIVFQDFIKRLIIFAPSPSRDDLYSMLLITPLVVAMAVAGEGLERLKSGKIGKLDWHIIGVSSLFVGALGWYARNSPPILANGISYIPLLILIPWLALKSNVMPNLMGWLTGLLFFSACYTVYQFYAGFPLWEWRYLVSGLTLEIRQASQGVPRVWGTFAAASNASVVFSVLGGLSLFAPWKMAKLSLSDYCLGILLAGLFGFAAVATLSRGGWVCGLSVPIFVIILRSKAIAAVSLIGGVVAVTLLFFSAQAIRNSDFVSATERMLLEHVDSDAGRQGATLGSINARLLSMELTATRPERWTPFGARFESSGSYGEYNESSIYFVHDFISAVLIQLGYIPLSGALLVVLVLAWMGYSACERISNRLLRRYSLLFGAGALAVSVGLLANPAQLFTFPLATIFWLSISFALACWRLDREANIFAGAHGAR